MRQFAARIVRARLGMSVRATAVEHIAEAKTVTLAEDGTLDDFANAALLAIEI
jgi:hypothetical protein